MSTIATTEVDYPASDGQPLGETDWHVLAIFEMFGTLRHHFAARSDVNVATNMFLYYREGVPSTRRAPDCMVIFGVENRRRRVFKTWEEGAVPSVIFEMSSDETYQEAIGTKAWIYASLGVPEYHLFDPLGTLLDTPLIGQRLVGDAYEPIPLDPDGGFFSPALGLRLVPEGHLVRLIDPRTGRPLPTMDEQSAANRRLAEDLAEESEARRRLSDELAEKAEARRRLAEELAEKAEENRRLSEELNRLRGLIADRGTIDENPRQSGA